MLSVALVVALQAPVLQQDPVSHGDPAEQLPLRVLYAGNADTPYTAAWLRFLGAHVDAVTFVAGRDLRARQLTGIDLLIVDGEVEAHDASGQLSLKSEHIELALDDLQGLPVVLMGGQGGFLSDTLHLKTSWHHG
ncbi:MAG: hypothetical protein H6835_09770 [Planctomycetes bacterium]|nr:hypothetical protein [Planctomycetota bacterium]